MKKVVVCVLFILALCNGVFAQLANLQRLALPAQTIELLGGTGAESTGELLSYCIDHQLASPTFGNTIDHPYKYFPVDEKCVYVDNDPPITFKEAIDQGLLSLLIDSYNRINAINKSNRKIIIKIKDVVVPSPYESAGDLFLPRKLIRADKENQEALQRELWELQDLEKLGLLDKEKIDDEKAIAEAKQKFIESNKKEFDDLVSARAYEVEKLKQKKYLGADQPVTEKAIKEAKKIKKIAELVFYQTYVYEGLIPETDKCYFLFKNEGGSSYIFDVDRNLVGLCSTGEEAATVIKDKLVEGETIHLVGSKFETSSKLEAFGANMEISIKDKVNKDITVETYRAEDLAINETELGFATDDLGQHKLVKTITDQDITSENGEFNIKLAFDSKYWASEYARINITAISKSRNILVKLKDYCNAKFKAFQKTNLVKSLKLFRKQNNLSTADLKMFVGSKGSWINIGKINKRFIQMDFAYYRPNR